MMQRICCSGCGKTGAFVLHLEITTALQVCSLHHVHAEKTSYWFCGFGCLKAWQDCHEVFEKGVPCPACVDPSTGQPTGFFAGFAVNGPCRLCDGKKRVLEVKREAGCDRGGDV